MSRKVLFILFSLCAGVVLLSAQQPISNRDPQTRFRGAWIATVANIDWPKPLNDSAFASQHPYSIATSQQRDLETLLDSLQMIGVNAIIFQVRPTADALYRSELEPWSHWLTGAQGSPTTYDPLHFAIEAAHARGMELHAWINPYRVNIAIMDTSVLAPDHLLRLHPEWFWQYGKQWYFNPALDVTRDWLCAVVEDIVCRYDIDAIHMDDYFYPYPIRGKELPDAQDYQRDPRGLDNIGDWRRDNVNRTIKAVHDIIRSTRPEVQFGISPFGIYSNGTGLTNYYDLYADVILWVREGWIDYVAPQLYWEIGRKNADYDLLARWWAEQVGHYPCRLYIGQAVYRLGGAKENTAWRNGNEIIRQMRLNETIEGIDGEILYSTRPLLRNPQGIIDSLKIEK